MTTVTRRPLSASEAPASAPAEGAAPHPPAASLTTACCIVGGGPAGMVLALLLARRGIAVTLLESHATFDRDFRGDTLHPSTLELMDELGLADRLLQLPHGKMHAITFHTAAGPIRLGDARQIKTRFPFIAMMPQSAFLDFLADEARRYPNFTLVMGAQVQEVIEEAGIVRGVRYQGRAGTGEVRALLTVGADGRFSRLRKAAGFEPITTSAPMDVLWFRLPRHADDPEDAIGRVGNGGLLIRLDRGDEWQLGFVIPKGSYKQLQAAGLDQLRRSVIKLAPEFAERLDGLREWKQVALLTVASDRLPRWYKPGLLLIGDAAHVMSPVGGNGINYAIQDAVAAANRLHGPLERGFVDIDDLAAVQRRREWPVRLIQSLVGQIQKRVISNVLNATDAAPPTFGALGLIRRLPLLPRLAGRIMLFGIRQEHADPALRAVSTDQKHA